MDMKFDFPPEEERNETAMLKRILETFEGGNDRRMKIVRDEELGRSILKGSDDGV
jgi:hypothetical protein